MQPKPIKVLIIDDHPMVIEGLKQLLQDDDQVVVTNCFTTGQTALDFISTNKADTVLLDVNLPDINGVEMVGMLLALQSDLKILGLSTYSEPSIINQMIKNGVKGYLLKNATANELVNALVTVYEGGFYFGTEIQKILAENLSQEKNNPKLTRREKHVLRLIADGKTTNQIAEELFISPLTVETHRRNLMQKMKVSNVAALVKTAIEKKMLT